MNLLLFPEELLERILEEVVLYPSPSHYAQPNLEAPSTNLGPSPISSPATTPKSSPSATRHVSPQPSPTRSRPPSPAFGGPLLHPRSPRKSSSSSSTRSPSTSTHPHGKCNATTRVGGVNPTPSRSNSSSGTSPTIPRVSPSGTALATPLDFALAPLLTCRLLSRIALPLYYRVVQLKSRAQAKLFLEDGLGSGASMDREGSLRGGNFCYGRRSRAKWIRRLVICGVWKEAGEVVRVLAELVNAPPQPSRSPRRRDLILKPAPIFKGKGKARDEADDIVRGEETPISLRVLEITVDSPPLATSPPVLPPLGLDPRTLATPPQDDDAEEFAQALRTFAACWSTRDTIGGHRVERPRERLGNPLRHIVLRKPQNVYLTQPRSKMVISAMASVVESAEDLTSVFVAFRISDDIQGLPTIGTLGVAGVHPHAFQVQHATQHQHQHTSTASSGSVNSLQQPGAITQLTSALTSRPRLRTFATMLPSVWNEAVLRVSQNESLERVVLLGLNGIPVAAPLRSSNRYSLQLPSRPSAPPLSHLPQSTSFADISHQSNNSTPGSPGGARRPRLSVTLPPNPVERVYAASTRDVNGFHPTNPNSHASAMEPYHGGNGGGYGGGGYVPMGTGLFMNQAKKHDRLCELIRSGAEPPPSLSHTKEERETLGRPLPGTFDYARHSPTFGPTRQHGGTGGWFPLRFDGSNSGHSTPPTRA